MATSVTQSLFGMTPEALQAQRDAMLNKQAFEFAQMTPMQQAQMGLFRGASQLGTGLAGLMGYQDPEMQRIKARQGLLGGIDMNNPQSMMDAAAKLQTVDPAAAQELFNRANEVQQTQAQTQKEQALAMKAMTESQMKQVEAAAANMGVQGRTQYILRKMPELTQEEAFGLAQDPKFVTDLFKNPELKTTTVTANGRKLLINSQTGETIKDLGEAATSETAALTAAIQGERLGALQDKREREALAARQEQRQAINALATAETDIDNSLATAEIASGLAPNTVLGGSWQAVASSIPWTDAKALDNLVRSLNSDKVIATLSQLKAQSRTGATGFGAVSEKELDLILAKTRALDPTDKMFRENLKFIVDGWSKIKNNLRKERLNLQGKQAPTKRFNPATGKLEEVK